MPIIDYKHQAKLSLTMLNNNRLISIKNKTDLKKYLDAIDVSPARQSIICKHILLLFKVLPDVVGSMQDRDLINKTFKQLKDKFSPAYFETVKNVGKAFIRWHNDGETPNGWRDIKSKGKDKIKRDLSTDDMISWNMCLEMISKTNSVQLKAIVAVLLDSGLRPSEFIDLRFDDVVPKEKPYYALRCDGKTGIRQAYIYRSVPYLQRWLSAHPTKQGPLWIMESPGKSHSKTAKQGDNIAYGYPALCKAVRRLGALAGIKGHLDFYTFRHSSAVLKKVDGWPMELAAKSLGHSIQHYTETYGRLSDKDIKKMLDQAQGISDTDRKKSDQNKICSICGAINEPKETYCLICRQPLDVKTAIEQSTKERESLKTEIMKELQKDIDRKEKEIMRELSEWRNR